MTEPQVERKQGGGDGLLFPEARLVSSLEGSSSTGDELEALKKERSLLARRFDKQQNVLATLQHECDRLVESLQNLTVERNELAQQLELLQHEREREKSEYRSSGARSDRERANLEKKTQKLEELISSALEFCEICILKTLSTSVEQLYRKQNLRKATPAERLKALLPQLPKFLDESLEELREVKNRLRALQSARGAPSVQSQLRAPVDAKIESRWCRFSPIEIQDAIQRFESNSQEFLKSLPLDPLGPDIFASWIDTLENEIDSIYQSLPDDVQETPDEIEQLEKVKELLLQAVFRHVEETRSVGFILQISPESARPFVEDLPEPFYKELLLKSLLDPAMSHALQSDRFLLVQSTLSVPLRISLIEAQTSIELQIRMTFGSISLASEMIRTAKQRNELRSIEEKAQNVLQVFSANAQQDLAVLQSLSRLLRERMLSQVEDNLSEFVSQFSYDPSPILSLVRERE